MDISSLLQSSIGQNLISGAASKLGMEESKAQSIVAIGLPVLMSAIQKNASNPQTASGLNSALESSQHDGSILQNLSGFLSQDSFSDGNKILGHLLGGKKTSVENAISQKSGAETSQVASTLSMLAPVVMGFMGEQKRQNNLDINGIAGMIGGLMQDGNNGGQQSTAMSIATKILDQDGDGSITDDIMELGSKFLGGLFKK
ncbi:MAG: DUF937 domain-containing protein [Flavobacteriales bacterium]|nr:DUF937 domain-containing protein [Flavobacteriales bacterium]